ASTPCIPTSSNGSSPSAPSYSTPPWSRKRSNPVRTPICSCAAWPASAPALVAILATGLGWSGSSSRAYAYAERASAACPRRRSAALGPFRGGIEGHTAAKRELTRHLSLGADTLEAMTLSALAGKVAHDPLIAAAVD